MPKYTHVKYLIKVFHRSKLTQLTLLALLALLVLCFVSVAP